MNRTDTYGQQLSCGHSASLRAWNGAWASFLHFEGDPLAQLDEANAADDRFVMGSVFTATYRLLGGSPPRAPMVIDDIVRVRSRVERCNEHEQGHAAALEKLLGGDFGAAARAWDELGTSGFDMAATRFAHDVYLHVGDAQGRIRSSKTAIERWPEDHPGYGAVLGQHAFALEEVGAYNEAERAGQAALALDPDDLWALHALAHVYESTDAHEPAMRLLMSTQNRWVEQELLAAHIWWHLAIRLLAAGRHQEALGIFDSSMPEASTAFRLCDVTSLLWRLELRDVDVGPRWQALADAWAPIEERHTCGFLDMHAALAFSRSPDHAGAELFWDGLAAAHEGDTSENAETFRSAVRPLVAAIRLFGAGRYQEAAAGFAAVSKDVPRVGGSIAQREIVALTETEARQRVPDTEENTP
ncbi:MAG: tetratricopeptide repeat protein [Acidimicrobiales bacterium]